MKKRGNLEIKPVERHTVTDQIVKQLGLLIRTGKMKPGTKLPNERELAEKFETTRARIREGLRALSLIGLIETHPGSGSFVSKNNDIPDQALELLFHREQSMFEEMYEARKVIEPQFLYTAFKKIQQQDIEALNESLRLCEKIIEKKASPEHFLEHIDNFDRIVASATNNSILMKLADVFISIKKNANLKMYKVPGAMENSLNKRKNIVLSLRKRDTNELNNAIHDFFESSESFFDDIEK